MEWITESRMAQLCRLPRSTWQSWVKDGFFSVPPEGAFQLADCIEVAIVAAVREHFPLSETRNVWEALRRSEEVARMVQAAAGLGDEGHFDLIIDSTDGFVAAATDDASLARAIRRGDRRRDLSVVPLANELRDLTNGFTRLASKSPVSAARAGRPRKASGNVVELRAQG